MEKGKDINEELMELWGPVIDQIKLKEYDHTQKPWTKEKEIFMAHAIQDAHEIIEANKDSIEDCSIILNGIINIRLREYDLDEKTSKISLEVL